MGVGKAHEPMQIGTNMEIKFMHGLPKFITPIWRPAAVSSAIDITKHTLTGCIVLLF